MTPTNWTGLIAISVRIYRSLLTLYPAEYRRVYGTPMVQLFRDVTRDRFLEAGLFGVVTWWLSTVLDLALSVIEQQRKVKLMFPKNMLAQLTVISLIVGGLCGAIAAISQLQPGSHFAYHGIYRIAIVLLIPAYLLLGLGNIGIVLRYGREIGWIARIALLLQALGGSLMIVGFVLSNIQESLWAIVMVGIIAHAFGAICFGLNHLQSPFLPMAKALPLIAGAAPLINIAGGLISKSDLGPNVFGFVSMFLLGVGWLLIGIAINRSQIKAVPITA